MLDLALRVLELAQIRGEGPVLIYPYDQRIDPKLVRTAFQSFIFLALDDFELQLITAPPRLSVLAANARFRFQLFIENNQPDCIKSIANCLEDPFTRFSHPR